MFTEKLLCNKGFPKGSVGKESTSDARDAGDTGSIPGSGRFSLEEKMATHSSILAWKIPWTEETGGLQSKGPQRVRHKLSNCALTLYTKLSLGARDVGDEEWINSCLESLQLRITRIQRGELIYRLSPVTWIEMGRRGIKPVLLLL